MPSQAAGGKAAKAGGDPAQQAATQKELQRASRSAHRAAAALRGRANEDLLNFNPTAFFRAIDCSAKLLAVFPTAKLNQLFQHLLGGSQLAPEPPPKPP